MGTCVEFDGLLGRGAASLLFVDLISKIVRESASSIVLFEILDFFVCHVACAAISFRLQTIK